MRTLGRRTATKVAWFLASLLLVPLALGQSSISYAISCTAPGWEQVFRTFGLSATEDPLQSDVYVVCPADKATAPPIAWHRPGRLLILVGDSTAARALGFVPSEEPSVAVRNLLDHHNPSLLIVWEQSITVHPTRVPANAKVLAEERWSKTPLVAQVNEGNINALWLATDPGNSGYERFPYLGNALVGAGFVPPLRGSTLWGFLDSAYRQRADLPFLAQRWRAYGIAALHVSAWQHWESEPARDAWLSALIQACHAQGILVYAWFEFPHVSDRFWLDHPECREQTALLQDAQLDWRKLINLSDADCARRVKQQTASLLQRFDWDGANLAEIYYESLHGSAQPARFTPMNPGIRREFQAAQGFDPIELFQQESPRHQSLYPNGLRQFLRFRQDRVAALHTEWLSFVQETAASLKKPLHLVVTQIDDRFDTSVRDSLAADSSSILSMMHQHPFTFLIEDPATIWNLGPSRYGDIARTYAALTPYPGRLAVDINIFPRYQEVYPTKQQTGMELYRLVNAASRAFPRVALYAEHMLSERDLPLLAAVAVPDALLRRQGEALVVESTEPVGLRWQGPARVNGRTWAARDTTTLWLPAGHHRVEHSVEDPRLILRQLSAELRQVRGNGRQLELHYQSAGRAIAKFNEMPISVTVDGEPLVIQIWRAPDGYYLLLPPGEHLVRVDSNTKED